jgi:hypothetical protein
MPDGSSIKTQADLPMLIPQVTSDNPRITDEMVKDALTFKQMFIEISKCF